MKHTLARTALGVTLADLLLKLVPLGPDRALLPGLMGLTRASNPGVAFGLLGNKPEANLALTALLVCALAFFLARERLTRLQAVASGLMLGGALGNLLDRAAHGAVSDYLRFLFMDFPVFNLADACLTQGTALLAASLLPALSRRRP